MAGREEKKKKERRGKRERKNGYKLQREKMLLICKFT